MGKSVNQRWLENFLTRTGIDSPRRCRNQPERKVEAKKPRKRTAGQKLARDNRRRGLIDKHGLCKTCKIRAISSGGTETPEAAQNEDQCLKCHIASRRRKPGRPKELDYSKPVCARCAASNVTTGESKTASYARRAGLCIRCYCSGKRGGDS